jgi:hypothetical protein
MREKNDRSTYQSTEADGAEAAAADMDLPRKSDEK